LIQQSVPATANAQPMTNVPVKQISMVPCAKTLIALVRNQAIYSMCALVRVLAMQPTLVFAKLVTMVLNANCTIALVFHLIPPSFVAEVKAHALQQTLVLASLVMQAQRVQ